MRRKLQVSLLCTALLVGVCLPAMAQYVIQAEDIYPMLGQTGQPWEQRPSATGVESIVPRFADTDQYAFGGAGFKINDDLGDTADNSHKIFIQNLSTFAFADTATAVVRLRTTNDVPFSAITDARPLPATNPFSRTFVVQFVNRRGIGLCVRPDRVAICNNTGRTVYGEFTGDNTHFVTYTLVASNNGNAWTLYRDGKLLGSGTSGSNIESVNATGDGVYICSSPNITTGSWMFDYIAYKAGNDPTWDPVPGTGQITGVVSKAGDPNTRIANAIVTLSNGTQTTTDGGGVYSFTGLDPNEYAVSVSAPGYFSRSYSGISLPYSASSPVIRNVELIPLPAETQVVYDNFERSPWEDLGTTEDPMAYPWDLTDEAGTASVAYQLFLQPLYAHGVSIGGGFLPANIDYSIDLGPLGWTTDPSAEWGGISYRQSMPNVYDSIGGQDPNQAGYLVWCPVGGAGIYLWRNGVVGYSPIHIDWSTAHRIRVIAYGDHHEILVDGLKVIDVMNNAKLSGGYVGVMRHNANLVADNLYISVLQDGSGLGTISGTIVDAANPSTPIAGAFVSHSDGRSATSDSNGAYSFSLNSFDQQRITVRAAGYLDKTVVIEPVFGANTVNVQLDADASYRDTIGEARKLTPGSSVSLSAKVITASWGGIVAYIEEPNRSSGIKVSLPPGYSAADKFGTSVAVRGTVEQDTATGELFIQASGWAELPVPKVALRHMFVNSQPGAGLDTTGLYVFDVGKVTSVDQANRTFTITRGGTDTKVLLDPSLSITQWPVENDWVSVDGVATMSGDTPETAVRTLKPWTGETPQYMANPGIEQSSPWGVWQGYPTPGQWGFQKSPNDGVQFAWENNDNPHGGTDCCRIIWTTDRQPNVYGFFYQLPGPPPAGEWYEFSAWVRGQNVSAANGGTNYFIDWNNRSWQLFVPAGTYDWTRISTYFTPWPGQQYMNIGLIVDNKCDYLDVDDVTIRPMRGIFTWIPGQ